MSDIKARVRGFIEDNFVMGPATQRLGDGDSFLAQRILDSTGFLELITFLEEHFGIEIEDHEMEPGNLDSLVAIDAFVRRKLASDDEPAESVL